MKEDKLLLDLLEQQGWVRCPQCGVSLVKLFPLPFFNRVAVLTGSFGKSLWLSPYHVSQIPNTMLADDLPNHDKRFFSFPDAESAKRTTVMR